MRVFFLYLLLIVGWLRTPAQNIWADPSYQLGDLLVYGGSGAMSRHLEPNYLNSMYTSYRKTPFFTAGFDYCFGSTGSAYWGVGLFASRSAGAKQSADGKGMGRFWSNSLFALRFTHHSAFFVRRELDMYSGYVLGLRAKRYEAVYRNGRFESERQTESFTPALGLTGTLRYSPSKCLSMYIELGLGYQLDLLHIGIAYNITSTKKTILKKQK